jgi:hypothetical protein
MMHYSAELPINTVFSIFTLNTRQAMAVPRKGVQLLQSTFWSRTPYAHMLCHICRFALADQGADNRIIQD